MPPSIRLSQESTPTQLILTGTINLFVVAELHQAALGLLDAGGAVDVNCRDVTHLDGSACQVLLALHDALRKTGADLRLVAVPEPVQRFLQWGGMSHLMAEAA
jgi:anti-anti-sigma factor